MIIKADLHLHTHQSIDGRQSRAQLLAAARKRGLDAVAITNHNQYTPALQAEGILLISGCEFSTDRGHITGLFLEREPQKVSNVAEEVVQEIHRCGGIAVWAHPFQKQTDHTLPAGIDAIETANARADYKKKGANARAIILAREASLPAIGGSDAHSVPEIGNAYTAVECEECTEKALKMAILNGNCHAILIQDTPKRMIGLSQFSRRRRMGGLKNFCIGLLVLIKYTLKK